MRKVASAARADLKALAKFRATDAAAGIAGPLDEHEAGLRLVLEIATTAKTGEEASAAAHAAFVARNSRTGM